MRFTLAMLMRLRSTLLEMSPESFCPFTKMRTYLLPKPFIRRNVPIELGAIDTCGIIRCMAASKVVMPCSAISLLESTCTGVAVDFSR